MIKLRPFNIDIVEIPLGEGDNRVPLPRGAQVLGVSVEDQHQTVLLSVATDKDRVRDTEERRFMALPHGTAAPQTLGVLTYIGSPRRREFGALHVFEIDSPEGRIKSGVTRGASVVNQQNGPVGGTSMQIGVLGGSVIDPRHVGVGVYLQ